MTTITARKLTALDRCDRCHAPAAVIVHLRSGGELLFCNHHTAEHSAALTAANATVVRGTT